MIDLTDWDLLMHYVLSKIQFMYFARNKHDELTTRLRTDEITADGIPLQVEVSKRPTISRQNLRTYQPNHFDCAALDLSSFPGVIVQDYCLVFWSCCRIITGERRR